MKTIDEVLEESRKFNTKEEKAAYFEGVKKALDYANAQADEDIEKTRSIYKSMLRQYENK